MTGCSCWFLAPLAVGQRAYVMVCCPSCVSASVRALTFSLNIFYETTYRILMKFYRNVPAVFIRRLPYGPQPITRRQNFRLVQTLQNLLKKIDFVKNCGCHGNKTEKKKN